MKLTVFFERSEKSYREKIATGSYGGLAIDMPLAQRHHQG